MLTQAIVSPGHFALWSDHARTFSLQESLFDHVKGFPGHHTCVRVGQISSHLLSVHSHTDFHTHM